MIFVIVLNFTGHRLKHCELFNGMELTEFLSTRTKISETICIKLKIHDITDVPVELIHKYYELKQWGRRERDFHWIHSLFLENLALVEYLGVVSQVNPCKSKAGQFRLLFHIGAREMLRYLKCTKYFSILIVPVCLNSKTRHSILPANISFRPSC